MGNNLGKIKKQNVEGTEWEEDEDEVDEDDEEENEEYELEEEIKREQDVGRQNDEDIDVQGEEGEDGEEEEDEEEVDEDDADEEEEDEEEEEEVEFYQAIIASIDGNTRTGNRLRDHTGRDVNMQNRPEIEGIETIGLAFSFIFDKNIKIPEV